MMRTLILFCLVAAAKQNEDSTRCDVDSVCVPAHLCQDNKDLDRGNVRIDIRFGFRTPTSCPISSDKCCHFNNLFSSSAKMFVDEDYMSTYGVSNLHKIFNNFCEFQVGNKTAKANPPLQACGYRNPGGIGPTIRGLASHKTQFGEFPWTVAILGTTWQNFNVLNYVLCGGSLIHPKVVLTSALCVTRVSSESLLIRAGVRDITKNAEFLPQQDQKVVEIMVPETFYDALQGTSSSKQFRHNDIALLLLKEPFELVENIKTICLPSAETRFDFARCIATGWGGDKVRGIFENIMTKTDVSLNECPLSTLHRSFICAETEIGQLINKAYGGNPLVCPIGGTDNRYQQAGFFTGSFISQGSVLDGYLQVAKFREWIDQILSFWNIESSYHTA